MSSSISLRECQEDGYQAMLSNPIGIVKMFCGTGKTRLFSKFVIDKQTNLTIIVFPRIILMNQYLKDYISSKEWKQYWKPFKTIGICSDTEMTDGVSKKAFTTEPSDIKAFLQKHATVPNVVTVTYQSLPTLVDVLKEIEKVPDILICDEAHHVTSEVNQDMLFTAPLSDACMRYLFTATPTKPMLNDPSKYGSVIYDYSHRDAVNDGVCNDFVISIMMSTEEVKEKHIYDAIVRAATNTSNGRALVYHSYAEADGDLQRTSVKQFRGQEKLLIKSARCLEKEIEATLPFTQFVCQAVTASTKNKKHILDEFENAPSDTLYVLHNCCVIAEGVDTKSANMCVFADPKQSYVSIVQNIGRITRIMEGEHHPGCVLIPCFVDKTKYEEAQGDVEAVDQAIREDMTSTGNFNGILNVLSALRQEDPELFDICLYYPKSYAPQEVMHEFSRKGWKVEREATSIGKLFDLSTFLDASEVAQELNSHVKVHTLSMETPIEIYKTPNKEEEDDEQFVTVFKNDETEKYCLMVKKKKLHCEGKKCSIVKAPRRPFQIDVHNNNDANVLWNVVDNIGGHITTAFIECVVGDNEERAVKKAKEFVEWLKQNDNRKPIACCKTKEQKANATYEQKTEQKWAAWLGTQKTAKQGKWNGTKCYDSVNDIISTHFGEDWYKDLKQAQIDNANKLVEWSKQYDNKKPVLCCPTKDKKAKATDEQKTEQNWASWLSCQKKAKQGKANGRTCYDSVNDILSAHFGEDWSQDVQQTQIENANNLVEWSKQNDNRKPIACCSTKEKKANATEEQKTEHNWARWLGTRKMTKHGKGTKFYDSVNDILSAHFGEDWSKDSEQAQIDNANQLVEWSTQNDNMKPLRCCPTKEKKAKATKEQNIEHYWAEWLHNQKNAKQGKGNCAKFYDSVNYILVAHFGADWWQSKKDSSDTCSIASSTCKSSSSSKTRARRQAHTPSEKDDVTTNDNQQRTLSKIEKLHQVYKRMKGANFTRRMQENPTEWHEYHEIASSYDTKDKVSPLDKITTALQTIRSGRKAIDLGCGLNKLQKKNTHLKWKAVDAVAADDTVTVGDLTDLPFKDESFHVAVLCRALWAIDREQVLSEAHRILMEGGQLIIVEAFRGWYDESTHTNELMGLIDKTDFEVVNKYGTLPNETEDVFQYIILQKKCNVISM